MTTANYKEAIRLNVIFYWAGNQYYPQDLFQMHIGDLRQLTVALHKVIKERASEDDLLLDLDVKLVNVINKDQKTELANLRFEIAKDILRTRLQEIVDNEAATDKKQQVQELTAILHQKRQESLQQKSEEELERMIVDLQQ